MKNLILVISLLITFGCSTKGEQSNTNTNSDTNKVPAQRNKALTPEGEFFEPLTEDSNYFEVVKLVGTPDAENHISENDLPMPLLLACYMKGMCIVFINKVPPFQKGLKSNYTYVGTIKVQPPEILHSAADKNLDILEVIRTTVIN